MKAKKSASSRPLTSESDNLNPLLESIVDAVVLHTNLDQTAVENLRRALASIG